MRVDHTRFSTSRDTFMADWSIFITPNSCKAKAEHNLQEDKTS